MVRTVTIQQSLLPTACALGEAAIWDTRRQRLYFVDIDGKKVFTYEPATGTSGFQSFEHKVTALALLQDDTGLVGTDEHGPIYLSFSTALPFPPTDSPSQYQKLDVEFDLDDGCNRFNEACVDHTGTRYLVGTMGYPDRYPGQVGGSLYTLQQDSSGKLIAPKVLANVTCSNGMGWSDDGKTMYFTDSWRDEIAVFDYDDGSVTNRRQFSKLETDKWGWPDGLCQDTDGGFWTARWKGSKVIRLTPKGELDVVIEFPRALNMTSCIFGGPNMDELYVTSALAATTDDDVSQYPQSGDIFVVKGLGYKGRERTRFSSSLA